MSEPATSFQMLMDAYIRGYARALENPDSQAFVHKAAYDYADKETAPNTPMDRLANQAAHVRLGMAIGKVDITESVKELCDMINALVPETHNPEKEE